MQFIFNPFYKIAGTKALLTGIVLMVIALVIGTYSLAAFDGVLDFHVNRYNTIWTYVAVYGISWLTLILLYGLAGALLAKSKFRWIDILGTTLLARAPLLLVAFAAFLIPEINQHTVQHLDDIHFSTAAIAASVLAFLCIIWQVALLYNSYRITLNIQGSKATWSFITVIILAEIASLTLIHYYYMYISK